MQQGSFLNSGFQPDYVPTSDEKTLALLSHILTFVAPILAPLIIYLLKKDDSGFIAYHARESLNFQITLIVVIIGLLVSIVGIFFIWFVGIAAFVLVIIAAIKASEGKLYKYPFTLRLIK